MEGWERVKYIMDEEGFNMNSFSEAIGINNNVTITRLINEKRNPSRATCQKIIARFPKYNLEWLHTGVGEIFSKEPIMNQTDEAKPLFPEHIIYVPLVNQYAHAGYLCGYTDTEYIESLPTIPFIVDSEAQGHHIAFEVKGDSMDNGTDEAYKEGDRLLCREIRPDLWVNSKLHIRKWDFVIVHEDGIFVKRIVEHDVNNCTITIHSLNRYYPDRILSLTEVKQIFNVIELSRPRRRLCYKKLSINK